MLTILSIEDMYLTKKNGVIYQSKSFALPSTNEGVGIVALEAAAMGCDIVITKLGGPKEYYSNMATVINPYNVDEIGKAICKALDTKSFQPNLAEYINKITP